MASTTSAGGTIDATPSSAVSEVSAPTVKPTPGELKHLYPDRIDERP